MAQPAPPAQSSWITAPAPIVTLFKTFPLGVLPSNKLPAGRPDLSNDIATLFVWAAAADRLSYNPNCLKWQAYLRFSRLPFKTVSSTNHASPTGSLPFLIPSTSDVAVPSNEFTSFVAASSSAITKPPSPPSARRNETYTAMCDSCIRPAWLYNLYISTRNTPLLERLYIDPVSTSSAIRSTTLASLRAAAEAEVLQLTHAAIPLAEDLYSEARFAFASLDSELGRSKTGFFFDAESPTEFDAMVFSYTHLMLDESLVWGEDTFPCSIAAFSRLVNHRDYILSTYWPETDAHVLPK